MSAFLIGAVGIGVMLAVGAFEKWRRQRGYSLTEREREHPLLDAFAEDLARAALSLDTEVKMFRDENDEPGLVALVRGLDPTFKLRTTGRTTGDVEVGHLGFDDQFHVQGATAMVRARLDGPTREALLELVRGPLREGQLTVADGQLRAVVPQGVRVSLSDPFDEAVPLLGQVARRLAEPIDVIAELAQNARRDPVSGVRVQCLRTLLREYPQHASVVNPLLRDAAEDADAEVRLEAAIALGPEGAAVLHALVADAAVEDDLAARAAEALGPRMDADVARATLRREMAASSTRIRRAAVARACTVALGEHGDPQDETLLLTIAVEERDEALRLAAVRALGRLGSARAVPALAELAGSGSPQLRRAGREAIATIQSRLQGATPGQLSLDPGAAGQVALADDAAGRVSDTSAKDER